MASAPPQPITSQPFHETADLTLEGFIKELGESVKAYFRDRDPNLAWYYEVDNEVHLKTMDSSDVKKLVFGQPFMLMDEWSEANTDYFYKQDDAAVRAEMLDQVQGKFRPALEKLAQSLEMDTDDLQAEILDSDELRHEKLDLFLHFNKDNFQDVRAANAHLGDIRLNPAAGAELFEMLQLLRIPLDDFLAEAVESIQNALDQDNDLNTSNQLIWGLAHCEPDDESKTNWTEAYGKIFSAEASKFTDKTGLTLERFDEPPVIGAEDLVSMVSAEDGLTDLYVHVTVGSSTIEDFSIPAGRHDLADSDDFKVRLCSGYISTNATPGEGGGFSSQLQSPINVRADVLSVLTDQQPESDDEDEICLTASQQVYARLYELVLPRMQFHLKSNGSEVTSVQGGLNASDDDDAACLHKCLAVMKKAPHWACSLAVSRIRLLQTQDVFAFLNEHRMGYSGEAQSVNSELISRLKDCQSRTDPLQRKKAIAAVDEITPFAFNLDLVDGNGLKAFDWACRRGLPLHVIRGLATPTVLREITQDRKDSYQHPLNTAVLRLTTVETGSRSEESLKDATEVIDWLLKQGSIVPAAMTSSVLGKPFVNLLGTQSQSVINSVMDRLAEQISSKEYRATVDSLLARCCQKAWPSLVRIFLERGGDPDAASCDAVIESERKNRNPEWKSHQEILDRFDDVTNVIRSHRARVAALQALKVFTLADRTKVLA